MAIGERKRRRKKKNVREFRGENTSWVSTRATKSVVLCLGGMNQNLLHRRDREDSEGPTDDREGAFFCAYRSRDVLIGSRAKSGHHVSSGILTFRGSCRGGREGGTFPANQLDLAEYSVPEVLGGLPGRGDDTPSD